MFVDFIEMKAFVKNSYLLKNSATDRKSCIRRRNNELKVKNE